MSPGGLMRVAGLAAGDGETERRRDGEMGRVERVVVTVDSGNLKLNVRARCGAIFNEIDFGDSGSSGGAAHNVDAPIGGKVAAKKLRLSISTGIERSMWFGATFINCLQLASRTPPSHAACRVALWASSSASRIRVNGSSKSR